MKTNSLLSFLKLFCFLVFVFKLLYPISAQVYINEVCSINQNSYTSISVETHYIPIDLSNYIPGIYFASIETDNESQTVKIVVK